METIATLGTWASSGNNYLGFKLVDDTNLPGLYELDLPNNILAAGVNQVTIMIKGTGIAPCLIEIQLANTPSNLTAILGTTLTETAGYLAAGFKALLNVASPVFDLTAVKQTGDAYGRIGAAGAGLTALGDTRIANLDATITSRTKPADTQAAVTTVATLTNAPPDSSGITTLLTRLAGALTLTSGKVDVNDKSGFSISGTTQTLDALATLLRGADNDTLKTLSDQIDLQALETTLTAIKGSGWTTETLKAIQAAIGALPAPDNTNIGLIKAKTDNLPTSPAAVGSAMVISGTKQTLDALYDLSTGDIDARLEAFDPPTKAEMDTAIGTVTAKTSLIPASPAAVGDIPSAASIASAVWGAITRTLTAGAGISAADVWGYVTRTLTSGGTGSGAIAWNYTLTRSDNGQPIADADIWVATDALGVNVIASGRTDQNGVVTFYLDAGQIFIFRQKSGFNFTNPDQEVVSQ
jgi:hypothetical protein